MVGFYFFENTVRFYKGSLFIKIYESWASLKTVLKDPWGLKSTVYTNRFAQKDLTENMIKF